MRSSSRLAACVLPLVICSLLGACAAGRPPAEVTPIGAPVLEQHAWLQQLVGTWEFASEPLNLGDGNDVAWEGTETIRSLGGLWVIAEGDSTVNGVDYHSLMTLGFDPDAGAFVGTWVDSIQTTLWRYSGQLDPDGRALTLSAAGPSIHGDGRITEYRDRVELVSASEKRTTSSMREADGSWTTYMRIAARRVK